MAVFGDYSYYYDALYSGKDYMSEANDVDSLLQKWGTGGTSIIVYGCGTGKHDRCLKSLGYKIKGIDLSEKMIQKARNEAEKEGIDIDYEVADIRYYASIEKYDAVISLFHVMSYQNSNEDIISAFHSARNALNKGGLFLFDSWYGPGVLTDRPSVRIKEIDGVDYRLTRIAQPDIHANDNVVDVNYKLYVFDTDGVQYKELEEVHHMRYFFMPEIRQYLKESQFELLEAVDCDGLGDLGFNSWTTYFIARAV